MSKSKSKIVAFLFAVIAMVGVATSYADQDPISLFPLDHYDQQVSNWINPSDPGYDKPLLTKEMQKSRLDIFYDHYYSRTSQINN